MMKILSAVILLVHSAWMTIYLYGEYAIDSAKYHPSLVNIPIILFVLALLIFITSALQMEQKNTKNNNNNKEEI